MKRCIHVDFHTMPGVADLGKNIDPEQMAQLFADAHVTWVNLFARCNIGFSYYPTKVGTVYPGLTRDLLGEWIEACHRRDIRVTAYLNVDLNHELTRLHPELCRVNRDGSILEERIVDNNFYRSACLNGPYREYLLTEIREILEKEPDGIFCDCMIPKPCYCAHCQEKMRALGMDPTDAQQVKKFAFDTVLELAQQIRQTVPMDKKLYLNSFPYDRVAHLCSHAELECLPTDNQIWGYDFFTTQAPYFRMFSEDRVYMTGRFGKSWGDYGGYRSAVSMECDVYDALMYGFCPSVGDHMDPVNGLDPLLYRQIGELYEKVMALEKWTLHAKPVTEAAILRNRSEYDRGRSASDKGAAKMLSELKVCFDIVNEDMELDGYKLLVLPNGIVMTEQLKQKLRKFSGNILSCGTSLDPVGRWDFVTDVRQDTNQDGFYSWHGRRVAMYAPAVKMKSRYSEVAYIEPYFERCWDGKHAYFYIPPGKTAGDSAIAGNCSTVHICFDIFKAYFENDADHLRETVEQLLRKLLCAPLLAGQLPVSARATLLRGETDLLQIKTTYPQLWNTTGKITEHVYLPAGRTVSVAGSYTAVRTVPDLQPLEFAVRSGRTEINLPQIEGYIAIELKR